MSAKIKVQYHVVNQAYAKVRLSSNTWSQHVVEEPISICMAKYANKTIKIIKTFGSYVVLYIVLGYNVNNFTEMNLNLQLKTFQISLPPLRMLSYYHLRLSQFIPLRVSISLYRLLTLYMNCYYASSNQRI